MDRDTSKASPILNQAGKVNEMISGVPSVFSIQGSILTTPTYKHLVIILCKMNLTSSWVVNVDGECRFLHRDCQKLPHYVIILFRCYEIQPFIQRIIFLSVHAPCFLLGDFRRRSFVDQRQKHYEVNHKELLNCF